ncbi:NAD(P)-dependent glycerol-3-phosphate dehydrogenase [Methylibium sp. Pch-M]|uniref:Glycerol-3-phosphate dehydrogenase [NAD(P)+] n=1 Tax=Methylibium petroleiphilum (strain ATCC BAA-1232 / LMG 22953 / PM1) TaxID=420662 RepID=GPDA_METPP|nr:MULTISPECIES: NAD(P)H-dependent glycerol-3-phosphate dehydrogenase [Methylibium]A2SDP0.1 RecName: Full=Glycerol-3-phosphate dehydrogenase [NAD(P)+]; AltName: Full=NAD(P)H-dependent glycerol-3-phosphate dehydrogenase [Methylibium petroleiphilum PM1]ABM93679.1 Glycerol-3-phosphate dehydrogenase (NAD(P)+) [Methylibium petroleiphilum PM1]QAZ40209.1 NAD(P)-dependent glycerol-3-phosphate dehydrogenase [Methylibium sp. Pch-M]
MRITVLGAGAWGTALSVGIAPRHDTLLWARDAAQAAHIEASRDNRRYLPGVALPAALRLTADLDAAIAHAQADGGLIVIATPMSGLREMLARCAASGAGLWWLCKGFEAGTGALGHEVAREVAPAARVGVLSGPSFALEVARGQPTALVAASTDEALRNQAVEAFHSESLRVYTSADPVGVEVGGAVKNVIAIATGIADGMGLGLNARAALVTRGLAEITRLGTALGARVDTFMGLSGLGDLVLTATGDLSRNRQVGLQLAQGRSLPEVLAALGHVAEGVYSAATVLARAQALGVDMPITAAVVAVLDGRLTPAQALERLMRRQARAEGHAPD